MKSNLSDIENYFRRKAIADIRFWIVLFFVLRLYGITDPPLESAHHWRQVTGDMVARNFYEIDNNILFPRLDTAGEKTGITGTEFPTLNYLMYLFSLIFGFYDWFGRLIVLTVSSFGILYFYKLLKIKFDERLSFYSAFLLLTSMWLMYSRKVMPDVFSVSFVIISLYFAFNYFKENKRLDLFSYFIFVTIGVLSKIPAAYLIVVLLFPLIDGSIKTKQKIHIIFATSIMFIQVGWWYFYWVLYLINHFEYSNYYMGTNFINGFHEILSNLGETADKFYFDALKFIGFLFFIFGIITAIINKKKDVLFIFIVCTISFIIFMMKAGRNFYHHSYYVIPFVPVMCMLAAYGVIQLKKQWVQTLFLFAITAESIGNQQHDFRIKGSEFYKLRMERTVNKISSKEDLFATNGGDNPQQMYFLNRKGWSVETEVLADSAYINYLAQRGCKFIFINKQNGMPSKIAEGVGVILYNDKKFVVYSVE
jgi:hypothetical protein